MCVGVRVGGARMRVCVAARCCRRRAAHSGACEAQGEARAGGSEGCVDFDAHDRYRGTTSRQCLAAWLAGGGGGVDGHRARVGE